jgi:hypothetical protein
MYGLKEAGKLFNLRLVSLLSSSFGFHETSTPCLFKHVSRPKLFVLVVDDFGVKYTNRSDFDFLVSCLSTLYHAKAHPIASKFLGFSVSHNRSARTFTVSYPGYASHLLARLCPHGVPSCNSPSIYTPPVFGSRAPQSPTGPDLSPSASPAQAKELQVAVGFLLYYGKCVDSKILPTTYALASEQASPTLSTMARLQLLLGYVAAHPDGRKIFQALDMLLRVLSDAFLSRPNAGSVAGGLSYLGLSDDNDWVSHPISCRSTRIPVVCSFVAEAEYASLYAAARIATEERKILANMGHPQPASPLFCDNEVAIGIASDTVAQRMSKVTDMRLHWVRDRFFYQASPCCPSSRLGFLHRRRPCRR